jgi:hypothetical protein
MKTLIAALLISSFALGASARSVGSTAPSHAHASVQAQAATPHKAAKKPAAKKHAKKSHAKKAKRTA